jgi:hypothetical protein
VYLIVGLVEFAKKVNHTSFTRVVPQPITGMTVYEAPPGRLPAVHVPGLGDDVIVGAPPQRSLCEKENSDKKIKTEKATMK